MMRPINILPRSLVVCVYLILELARTLSLETDTQQTSTQIQNRKLSTQPPLPTINQICSSQRGRHSNLCKPCRCNLDGAESPHCDIYTRRCSCLPGYTGNTCNKCSQGYYNPSSHPNQSPPEEYSNNNNPSNEQTDQADTTRTVCRECDGCYHNWRQHTTGLKEQAVQLIERAYKLDQAFNDQIGVKASSDGKPKLLFGGNVTRLSDIESSIALIGKQVLATKQKSDQLNLLEGELNSTISLVGLETLELADQKEQMERLDSRLDDLNYQVEVQSEVTRNLSGPIESFKRDLLDIQGYIPQMSITLVQKNRNRTRRALEEILQIDQQCSASLNRSIDELTSKLEKINYSKRQLDLIGTKILTNSLKRLNLADQSIAANANELATKFSAEEILDWEHFNDNTMKLEFAARYIADTCVARFDSYQANFDTRSLEMTTVRKQIEEAKTTLLITAEQLAAFEGNLTSWNLELASTFGESSYGSDFNRLLEQASLLNRASLGRVDVKWNQAQADIAEFGTRAKNFNETLNKLTNLTSGMQQVLARNLPALIAFKDSVPSEDLDELMDFKNRTKSLAGATIKLKEDLANLNELKQTTIELVKQTQRLNGVNRNELEKTSRWLLDTSGDNYTEFTNKNTIAATGKPSDLPTQLDLLNSTTKALLRTSKIGLDKIRAHQSEALGRKVLFDRQFENKMNGLRNVTSTNEQLAGEVEEKLAVLSECLDVMTTANVTNTSRSYNSIRATKLSERRRLANVITTIRHMSVLLHKNLASTNGLAEEFALHERVFADQRKTIDSLHNQMDVINVDLEKRYDYYENCPSS